jgi:hypothetical protein
MAVVASVEAFDLDRYLRASKRVDLSGVEWDLVRMTPLLEDHARCLTYMMDIETHTAVFLRDLLATRAGFDPDVTAFLSCWAYEEVWHGEAFSRFLGEAGYKLGPTTRWCARTMRTPPGRRGTSRSGVPSGGRDTSRTSRRWSVRPSSRTSWRSTWRGAPRTSSRRYPRITG